MSGSQGPGAKPPPKTMSSRLLTMKFMQRAVASNSPTSSSGTDEGPRSKRRKISRISSLSLPTPASPTPASPTSDARAVQLALAAEEAKRREALGKFTDTSNETKWVLSFKTKTQPSQPLRVMATSLAAIDSDGHTSGASARGLDTSIGRRSYGKFNRALESTQNSQRRSNGANGLHDAASDGITESESDEDMKDSELSNDASTMIRKEVAKREKLEHRAQRKAVKANAVQTPDRPFKSEKLTSISNRGPYQNSIEEVGNKRSRSDEEIPFRGFDSKKRPKI